MNVIIIGATSGIGRALAKELSDAGCVVGVTGRRLDLLKSLEEELPKQCFKSQFDVTNAEQTEHAFNSLVSEMGGIDAVVINSGFGSTDPDFPLVDELQTVAVNVAGFTAVANLAFHYFQQHSSPLKPGHIIGISSVAAVRGGPFMTYNASKAYVSSYLEGLACRREVRSGAIAITDIRPGFVDTPMAQGEGLFWVASPEKAARQIAAAIRSKRRVVYITKRWRLIAILIKVLPFRFYRKLIGQGSGV